MTLISNQRIFSQIARSIKGSAFSKQLQRGIATRNTLLSSSHCSKHGRGCCCGNVGTHSNSIMSNGISSHPIRFFASNKAESNSNAKKSDPESNLIKKLEQEMKFEVEDHEYADQITSTSQSLPEELSQMLKETGFQLSSKQGEGVVYFTKETPTESIKIEFDVEQIYNNDPYELDKEMDAETEDIDNEIVSYQLDVTIRNRATKDSLKADVWLHDDFCELHGLQFVPGNDADSSLGLQNSKRTFSGPSIEDLDEELQESLNKYLVSKGIDDALYEFLSNYCNFKESAEYYNWCKNVKNFFTSSK